MNCSLSMETMLATGSFLKIMENVSATGNVPFATHHQLCILPECDSSRILSKADLENAAYFLL